MYHFRFMMGYCYIHLNLWLNGSFKLSFVMCRLLRSHSHLMSHDSLYWGLTFQVISCSPLPKTSLSTRILGSELQLSYWGSPVILNILFLNKKFLSWYVVFPFLFSSRNFFFFFWLQNMQYLNSLTRNQTCHSAVEAQSLNHWTAREAPES